MLIATIASIVMAQAPLSCAVMGSPVKGKGSGSYDYNGARYTMCCAGCNGMFEKSADKYVKQAVEKKWTIGTFLYDPTTGVKIEAKDAKGTSDFGGLRYHFASADAKKTFDANPKKFATQPKKEALWCPVMNHGIADYTKAGAYVDQGDTRYYLCCGGCLGKMKDKPAEYAAKVANKVTAPKVLAVKG